MRSRDITGYIAMMMDMPSLAELQRLLGELIRRTAAELGERNVVAEPRTVDLGRRCRRSDRHRAPTRRSRSGTRGWSRRAVALRRTVAGKTLAECFPGARLDIVGRAIEGALTGASTLLTNALHPELLPLTTRAGRPLLHDVVVAPLLGAAGGG